MAIPLKYNIGNLTARRMSTVMTILGIAVVIAVMLSMMALYHGVKTAIVSSGSKENLMIMREGAEDKAGIRARVAAVPLPETDPVAGKAGPMFETWRSAALR